MNNNNQSETIELTLPLNGAYVSSARLTVASIANRMGFDVDEIEDLKAAVSEACIYIIKKAPVDFRGTFRISFFIHDTFIKIQITTDVAINFEMTDEEMGLVMIKALMDEIEAEVKDNTTHIVMSKCHKQTSF